MELTSALATESATAQSAPTRLPPAALAAYCNVSSKMEQDIIKHVVKKVVPASLIDDKTRTVLDDFKFEENLSIQFVDDKTIKANHLIKKIEDNMKNNSI